MFSESPYKHRALGAGTARKVAGFFEKKLGKKLSRIAVTSAYSVRYI